MHTGAETARCPFSGQSMPSTGAVSREAGAGNEAAGSSGKLGRRTLLGATLGGLLSARLVSGVAGLGGTVKAFAAKKRARKASHGEPLRGLDIAATKGRDKEARFGLMFKKLPAYSPSDALLKGLAAQMNDGKAPLSDVKDSDVAFDSGTPAGYVYFGQFIDHDMTRDTTPLTDQQQDPKAMTNFDTPRFDLGSVYGGGPTANPELYDPAKPGYMLLNPHDELVDLPRDDVGAAYLGDPRNDENLIIAQLQTVFLRLHNTFRDQGKTFAQAQELCRWHYQWLIVHDFLPRVVGKAMVNRLVVQKGKTLTASNTFYKPQNPKKPYMPIEYAGAAYRFGHSMIRAEYEVQDGHTVPIFGRDGYEDLRGSRPIPHDLWIDWNYFFDIPGVESPDDRNMARRLDTEISLPLCTLPSTVVAATADAIVALAERNLIRGKRIGLPSGQEVAVAMGVKPLSNAQLGLTDPGWANKAPLWFYVLKEAELGGGQTLGAVGGRIVAEVILGLLALDKTSYFNTNAGFNPGKDFAMGSLIKMAGAFDERALVKAPDPEVPDPELPEAPEAPEPVDPGEVVTP
jgi:hypothetical protein